MANDNGVGKGLLIGFLTGSIVGSLLGLLYAPKSGKELRGEIKDMSDDYLEEAEEYIKTAKVKANSLINDGKKKSEELVADAKVRVDSLIDEAEKVLTNAKKKSDDYVELGKSKFNDKGDKLKSAIKKGLDTYKTEVKEEA